MAAWSQMWKMKESEKGTVDGGGISCQGEMKGMDERGREKGV